MLCPVETCSDRCILLLGEGRLSCGLIQLILYGQNLNIRSYSRTARFPRVRALLLGLGVGGLSGGSLLVPTDLNVC